MKVAKLEIKIIMALLMAGYEYNMVDSSGNFPGSFPLRDYNDLHRVRSSPFSLDDVFLTPIF